MRKILYVLIGLMVAFVFWTIYRSKDKGNDDLDFKESVVYELPDGCDSIAPLGLNEWDKDIPFHKVRKDGLWGVYDVSLQEFLFEPEFDSIDYCEEKNAELFTWSMWKKFAIDDESFITRYYFRLKRSEEDSLVFEPLYTQTPYYSALENDLSLRLDPSMPDAKVLEDLLSKILNALWEKDDMDSYAHFYWDWETTVTAFIDSVAEAKGLFQSADSSRYEMAWNAIDEYICYSEAGTQADMNCYSYVLAVMSNYFMLRTQKELVKACPQVNFRKEYNLYNEFMSALEDFEEQCDRAYDRRYSAKPMDDNYRAQIRFEERDSLLAEILDLFRGGKSIEARTMRPSEELIKLWFHRMTPNVLRPAVDEDDEIEPTQPSDIVGMHFLYWVLFRDSIAEQMPESLRQSYINQTTNKMNDMLQWMITFIDNDYMSI